MAENKISYLTRNYDECKNAIIDITKQYYPDVFDNLNDASVGAWLVEVMSDIYDALNYHIDRCAQETTIDSAAEFKSIQDIARTNGFKLPYKKAAMVEIEMSCEIPVGDQTSGDMSVGDELYCPYIKRGTKFSTGSVTFELNEDINFREQFDSNGYSNRQIIPNRNANGNIISYTYKKLATASACQSKIYKKIITANELVPFMEVLLVDNNILGVESVLVKKGANLNTDPDISEFYYDEEDIKDKNGKTKYTRFFEVDNLIDQYRYGYEIEYAKNGTYNPDWEDNIVDVYDDVDSDSKKRIGEAIVRRCVKGKWKRLKHKFTTEYTDDWKLKLIFGPGVKNQYGEIPEGAKGFVQYQMSRMTTNDYMGVLPDSGTTMYVLYRVGGGEISNIATGTLTSILSLDIEIQGNCNDNNNQQKVYNVRRSLKVTNTTPSYGGRDEPTLQEIRHMIKYNNAAQNRCVTLKDYYAKISEIPAKYGCPFRHSVVEENNKVVIYTIGLDENGKLSKYLAEPVAANIKEYLKMYKSINDLVEIKSGKIINIAFRLTVYVDKTYDKAEVTKRIIDTTYDYMDIRKHLMGEDIFLGDLEKEISKLDGVVNLVDLQVQNKFSEGSDDYSNDVITQQFIDTNSCCYDEYESYNILENEIDLKASDYMLFSEANSMFEIKNKNSDITVVVKTRN